MDKWNQTMELLVDYRSLENVLTSLGVFCPAVRHICVTSYETAGRWLPPAILVGALSDVPLHFSLVGSCILQFFQAIWNAAFVQTSHSRPEKRMSAVSQRGVRPPCTSVRTGITPHMYTSVQTSQTAGRLSSFSPTTSTTSTLSNPAEALWLVKCRNVCAMPMQWWSFPCGLLCPHH